MRKTLTIIAVSYFAIHGAAFAQNMPISTDGTDPKTWDPKLDATIAAAKNHMVVFENDDIRVLSVTVAPGEVEALHHHRWPSVLIIDKRPKAENRDASGKLIPRSSDSAATPELPIVLRVPPEAAHALTNLDTFPYHLMRIEFKKGFPKQ